MFFQVRELIDFIQDDDKLRDERKKAKKNKDKYIGMSSDAMGMRMGAGSYNDGNNWDSSKSNDRNWCKFIRLFFVSIRLFTRVFVFIDSEQKSKDSYEDDYQYDGEREDSDVESTEPPSTRQDNSVFTAFYDH